MPTEQNQSWIKRLGRFLMRAIKSLGWIPLKVRVYGLLVLLSLLFLALGYQIEHGELGHKLEQTWGYEFEKSTVARMLVHFVNEIGIAGLVGFLLALTIENLSQKEFRKLAEEERTIIKKDVFYYVYGHEIPAAIRDEINEHILKVPFVRKNVIMQYKLEPVCDPQTKEWYVLTSFTMNYDVENLTSDEQRFPFSAAIDKSPSEAFSDRTRFRRLSVQGCKAPFDWQAEELAKHLIDRPTEWALVLKDQITVLPKQLVSEDHQVPASPNLTHITLKTDTVRFLQGGHIDFTFTSHICDLNLMVWSDSRLKVSATTLQNPLERVDDPPPEISWLTEHLPSGKLECWRLQKPLLAYQSLTIAWTPNVAAVAEPQNGNHGGDRASQLLETPAQTNVPIIKQSVTEVS